MDDHELQTAVTVESSVHGAGWAPPRPGRG